MGRPFLFLIEEGLRFGEMFNAFARIGRTDWRGRVYDFYCSC